MRKCLFIAWLVPVLILVGCRQPIEPSAENIIIDVAVDTDADTLTMGETALLVTVTDMDGNPIDDATVTVRGDMTHAGMVPVIPNPVTESTDGVYTVPFEFTMGGDWVITVDVEFFNGEVATATVNLDGVEGTMPEDMGDMEDEAMDMSDNEADMSDNDMGDMDMNTSAVSGGYLAITNNRTEDATLVSATAESIGSVELHETIIDANDMASMQQIEGGLLIPAGETVELRPGGLHLMLMQLQEDLIVDETVAITLTFADGTAISVDAPIATAPVVDVQAIAVDGIEISAYWVRPVVANP